MIYKDKGQYIEVMPLELHNILNYEVLRKIKSSRMF